jgi:hypothetical protein
VDIQELFYESKIFKQVDILTPLFSKYEEINTYLGNIVVCLTNIIFEFDKIGYFKDGYIPNEQVLSNNYINSFRLYQIEDNIFCCYRNLYTLAEIKKVNGYLLLKWDMINPFYKSMS